MPRVIYTIVIMMPFLMVLDDAAEGSDWMSMSLASLKVRVN